jgi:hypothetical protein
MGFDQTVIYVAGSMQQAHMLRNLLAEHGIQAAVINDALERGSGVDYIGWNTAARVVVHPRDAIEARRIALEHDDQGAKMAEEQYPCVEEAEAMPEDWPRCPECGAQRLTRCPVCKTTGTEFAEADSEYIWGMGLAEAPDETPSCGNGSCGGGSCGGGAPANEVESAVQEKMGDEEDDDHRLILVCPTCDEPFEPEFPRTCAWCDHEFPDGYEPENTIIPPAQCDTRVTVIVVGLLVLLTLVIGYFMFVV